MAFPPVADTPPTLATWQWQYNGLTFGDGTSVDVVTIKGLDLVTINSGDTDRASDLGEFAGPDRPTGRDITLALDLVDAATDAAVTAAFQPPADGLTESPLWVQLPGYPMLGTMVRTRKRARDIDQAFAVSASSKPSVLLRATDPRLYAAPQVINFPLPTPAGGATPPFLFPLGFGGGASVTIRTAVNAGNIEMRPIIVFTGPMTNPFIQNSTTGWALAFSNPFQTSFTLNAGDTLTIDTDTHSVSYLASGTTAPSPRPNWEVTGSIWPNRVAGIGGFVPGSNTFLVGSGDASAVAGVCNLQLASAYDL